MYSEQKQALAAELSFKHPAVLAVSGSAGSGKTALLAALLPLMGAVIAFLYRKVNRPIVTLSGASAHIEQGEFGIQVDAGRLGSKEFAYLGNSFNAMSDKLKNQFERIYKEELALRDMDGEPLTRENYGELMERIDAYLSEFDEHGTDNISVDLP